MSETLQIPDGWVRVPTHSQQLIGDQVWSDTCDRFIPVNPNTMDVVVLAGELVIRRIDSIGAIAMQAPRAKRFAVYPGFIISRNDGSRHYVKFHDLCRLYRVNPADCICALSSFDAASRGMIPLRPRWDGSYYNANLQHPA